MTREWSREEIIRSIEAHDFDHEEGVAPPEYEQILQPDLKMRKLRGTNSIGTNFVVHFAFAEDRVAQGIQTVRSFFDGMTFGWWVGPLSKPANLADLLKGAGFEVVDHYVGLALPLAEWKGPSRRSPFDIVDAEQDPDVRQHARISAEIWRDGGEPDPKETERRLRYAQLPHRRGGYVLARDAERGVGNATWRISHDGRVMYLTGAAVVPSCRKKGAYMDMLAHRLKIAKAKGCVWVTTQAREGHSEPILRKLGFREYAKYTLLGWRRNRQVPEAATQRKNKRLRRNQK